MPIYHENSAFPGLFSSQTLKEKYARVDHSQLANLRRIHFSTPVPSFCRKLMMEMLFKESLAVVIDKEVQSSSDTDIFFQELLKQYYVPFLQDAFDELMTLGMCIVRIVDSPTGQKVPTVVSGGGMGTVYEIRVFTDIRTGKPFYQVFWLLDNKGETLKEPKKARNAFVFNTLLKGPTIEGDLQSPLAPLAWQEYHFEEMMQCDRVANFNLSDPTVLTVSPNTDSGVSAMEIGTPRYSERDALADLQGVYAHDAANAAHMRDQMSTQRTGREWYPSGNPARNHVLKRHLDNDNIRSLPMGNNVVTGLPLPRVRSDLLDLINLYYSLVCSAYGLDRRFIFPDGSSFRTSDSSTLLRDRMDMTQRLWSQRLSEIATTVVRHIYKKEQCNILFKQFVDIDPEIDFETLVERVDVLTDIQIVLPISIAPSLEEMRRLYEERVISWGEYFTGARSWGGFLDHPVPPEPKLEVVSPAGAPAAAAPSSRKRKAEDKSKSDDDGDKSEEKPAKSARAEKKKDE